jgi:hypothetical protein
MPIIKEGALTFQFPDSWKVVKLDDWSFYHNYLEWTRQQRKINRREVED